MPGVLEIKDYYAVLGVASSAGPEEIKRRFRHLAKQSHPDVAASGSGAERFLALQEAYRVLSDPAARERYDRARGREQQSGQSGKGWSPPREAQEPAPGGGTGGGIGRFVRDFLGDVWRPGDPPAPPAAPSAPHASRPGGPPRTGAPGRTTYSEQPVPVMLDLAEAFTGKEIILDGVRVRIPAGARQGSVLRVPFAAPAAAGAAPAARAEGRGAQHTGPGPGPGPGPAAPQSAGPYRFVNIIFRPDPRYRLVGDDLQVDVAVGPALAEAGGELQLTTPAGPLTVAVPAGIASGQVLRLRGRGLPPTSWRRAGDLLVRVVRAGERAGAGRAHSQSQPV